MTDADGKFKLDAISEFEGFVFIVGDRFGYTDLVIQHAGHAYLGVRSPGLPSKDAVKLDCDLTTPIQGVKPDQFCRLSFAELSKD